MNLEASNPDWPSLVWFGSQRSEGVAVLEFFTAEIRNANTRRAYAQAAGQFAAWAAERGLELKTLTAPHLAAYIEQRMKGLSTPSVKMHLAALRSLLDSLVRRGVLPYNPASSVRAPRYSAERGKTPIMAGEEMRILFESIGSQSSKDLRDRALLSVMIYGFARVGAVVKMKMEDYYEAEQRQWFRFYEKNGKRHEVPVHREAAASLEAWIAVGPKGADRKAPLFPSMKDYSHPLNPNDVLRMIKRRGKAIGLSSGICCHSFRATGITLYLEGGGTLEKAQRLAAHSSPRTTKLYDRSADNLSTSDLERIRF